MKVSGGVTIARPRQAVWEALRDPGVLGRALPGCEALEVTAPGRCTATVTAGVASLAGTYRGTIEVVDEAAPHSYRLHVQGAGEPGTFRADVLLRLDEDGEGTIVSYSAEAILGGLMAQVGQGLLVGVANRTASEFLAALDRDLATQVAVQQAQPSQPARTAERRRPESPTAESPQAETSSADGGADHPAPGGAPRRGRRRAELALAALIGAIVGAVGVVLGRRPPG